MRVLLSPRLINRQNQTTKRGEQMFPSLKSLGRGLFVVGALMSTQVQALPTDPMTMMQKINASMALDRVQGEINFITTTTKPTANLQKTNWDNASANFSDVWAQIQANQRFLTADQIETLSALRSSALLDVAYANTDRFNAGTMLYNGTAIFQRAKDKFAAGDYAGASDDAALAEKMLQLNPDSANSLYMKAAMEYDAARMNSLEMTSLYAQYLRQAQQQQQMQFHMP